MRDARRSSMHEPRCRARAAPRDASSSTTSRGAGSPSREAARRCRVSRRSANSLMLESAGAASVGQLSRSILVVEGIRSGAPGQRTPSWPAPRRPGPPPPSPPSRAVLARSRPADGKVSALSETSPPFAPDYARAGLDERNVNPLANRTARPLAEGEAIAAGHPERTGDDTRDGSPGTATRLLESCSSRGWMCAGSSSTPATRANKARDLEARPRAACACFFSILLERQVPRQRARSRRCPASRARPISPLAPP